MKCELVARLLHRPQVMFLDEPTLGLDVTMQGQLRRFLAEYNRRSGVTVILTSHSMADVSALCPRVILIHRGALLLQPEYHLTWGNSLAFIPALVLLGVYLSLSALRGLVLGPSLEALAGMDGEVWSGRLDFTPLQPIDIQFLASLRYWRPLALVDLALGLIVLVLAVGLLVGASMLFRSGLRRYASASS